MEKRLSKISINLASFLVVSLIVSGCVGTGLPGFFTEEESKELSSIDDFNLTLKPGGAFDQKALPALTPRGKWIKIPKWLAGEWQSESFTLYFSEQEGEAATKERKKVPFHNKQTFGHKKDKEGNIWHCLVQPLTTDQVRSQYNSVKQITWKAPAKVEEEQVTLRFYTTTINVEKKTNTVADITKNISEQKYSAKSSDHLLCKTKQYGQSARVGKFKKKARMHLYKKQDFQNKKIENGFDLDKSFEEFLKSQNNKN